MADVRTIPDAAVAPDAPPAPTHVSIRREDYREPDWLVPEIRLVFDLGAARTRVRATLNVERNGSHDRPLRLDGDELKLVSVQIDGMEGFPPNGRRAAGHRSDWRRAALVETEVEISSRGKYEADGPLRSGGILCTQCEAQGFRRITFFPDRPDVLSRYRVRMDGRETDFPLCFRTATGLLRRRRTADGIGQNGTTLSRSPATCSRWSRVI